MNVARYVTNDEYTVHDLFYPLEDDLTDRDAAGTRVAALVLPIPDGLPPANGQARVRAPIPE
jgi:hypothetical protein